MPQLEVVVQLPARNVHTIREELQIILLLAASDSMYAETIAERIANISHLLPQTKFRRPPMG